jgi:C1A family cysteine protease
MGLAGAHSQSLPTSYDLRSVNGAAWVSAIQNQGHAEDCWTFASATAMDSSLLRSGLLPTSPTPPASYVSAWHLSTNNGAPDQLEASEAFSENTNWGGDLYQTLGYVTRGTGQWQIPNATRERVAGGFRFQQTMGGGPVFNSQNPLNPFPVSITGRGYPAYLGSLVPPASQVIPYRVSSMSIYEQGFANNVPLPPKTGTVTIGQATYDTYTFNQGAADPQVAVIKNALLSSGAVTTGMNAGRDLFVNTMNTIQYFNNRNATGYANHAVTIIGWNDAYTMTNPTTHVSSTGAWLVQNSWGLWDDGDGTF